MDFFQLSAQYFRFSAKPKEPLMSTSIVLSPASLLSISDGDTPEVKMGVRMLEIDAPELHFKIAAVATVGRSR
jgi:endonuclease YncB( thermonuclease family)